MLADVGRRMSRLEGDFLEVVQKWSESIESKDVNTQGHCERVAEVATALAAKAGLDETSLFWFRIGALLHDVGKLIIPAEVLNKPGKLTEEEWALMRQHPAAGQQLLADVQFPWDVAPMVRSHHERWDGAGYPDGLVGEDIPFSARILCVADHVYDARRRRNAATQAEPSPQLEAIEIMRREVGRPSSIRNSSRTSSDLVSRGMVNAAALGAAGRASQAIGFAQSRCAVLEEDDPDRGSGSARVRERDVGRARGAPTDRCRGLLVGDRHRSFQVCE